jgi:hypothetical protein
MHRLNKKLITYFFAFMLTLSNVVFVSSAAASTYYDTYYDTNEKPSGGAMLLDAVLVRPPMFVGTLMGAVAFVITLPFSALGGNVDEAAQSLVYEPAKTTFLRPLGDL